MISRGRDLREGDIFRFDPEAMGMSTGYSNPYFMFVRGWFNTSHANVIEVATGRGWIIDLDEEDPIEIAVVLDDGTP